MKRVDSVVSGVLFVLIAAVGVGCDGESDGGGGTGGGGEGGSAGSTSSGDMLQCTLPQCFLDLLAPCETTETCTQSSMGGATDGVVNVCYDNGVKWSTQTTFSSSSITSHLEAYGSDGSLCFTADGATEQTGNKTVYKDASGAVAVTVTVPLSGNPQTYECDGETYTVDFSGCGGGGDGTQCTMGDCAVP